MNELIRKEHVISVFIYFLSIILTVVLILKQHDTDMNILIGSLSFLVLSFLVLSFVLIKKRLDGVYEIIFFSFYTLMAFDVQYYVKNIFILYLFFMIEWVICIAGMRKAISFLLMIIQVASICAFTFLPESILGNEPFSLTACIVSIIMIGFVGYSCNKVIESFRIVMDDNKDELKSMDDLYRISSEIAKKEE